MPRSDLITFCIKQACTFKQVKISFVAKPMPKGMASAGCRPHWMLQVPGGLFLLLVTQRRYHGTVCGILSLQQATPEVPQ